MSSCSLNPNEDKNIRTAILTDGVNEWANQLTKGKSVEKSTALAYVTHVKGEMDFVEWVDYLNTNLLLTPKQAKEINKDSQALLKQYDKVAEKLGVKLSKNDNILTRKRKLKAANKENNISSEKLQEASGITGKIFTSLGGGKLEYSPFDEKSAIREGSGKKRFKRHSTSAISGFFSHLLPKNKEGGDILKSIQDTFIEPVEAIDDLVISKSRQSRLGIAKLFKKNKLKSWKIRNTKSTRGFTVENAISAYMFSKKDDFVGSLLGASPVDTQALINFVEDNPQYKKFADEVFEITGDQWITPTDSWDNVGLQDAVERYYKVEKRSEWLEESGWSEMAKNTFDTEFYNRLTAAFKNGKDAGDSLKLLLTAMKTGSRFSSQSSIEKGLIVANSTLSSATLGFHPAIAVKQTTSALNFMEVNGANNPYAFITAMGTKEYYKIMSEIWKSDYAQNRLGAASFDVDASEVVKQSSTRGILSLMNNLRKQAIDLGFSLVGLGDLSAILVGGPAYMVNYMKKFQAEGLSYDEAYKKAFQQMIRNAETTQQSKKVTKITAEQLKTTGKLLLTYKSFQQQALQAADQAAHEVKRAGDGDWKKAPKEVLIRSAGKIVFYKLVSPAIFGLLTEGALSSLLDSDDDDERELAEKTLRNVIYFNLEGRGIKGNLSSLGLRIVEEAYNQSTDRKRGFQLDGFAKAVGKTVPLISVGHSTYSSIKWGVKSRNVSSLELAARVGDISGIGTSNIYEYVDGWKTIIDQDLDLAQDIHIALGWRPYSLGIRERR